MIEMLNFFSRCRKPAFLVLSLLLSLNIHGFGQKWIEEHARAVITPFMMSRSIGILSSDSMKGHKTSPQGADRAAAYIAKQFESFNVRPLKGGYFQDLRFCYYNLGKDLFLSLVKDHESRNFILGSDFMPFVFSGSKPAEGDIVFAGYGITAPEYHYDDYKEIDVKGRVVVVLMQEPGQSGPAEGHFNGRELTRYSDLRVKQKTAREHGAAGVIVIPGPLNYTNFKPDGYHWPCAPGTLAGDSLPMADSSMLAENIPVVSAGDAVIRELFGNVDTLKRMQQHIDNEMKPHSFLVQGRSIVMNISYITRPVGGKNVIGYIEGADPQLKNEAVVIGSHYAYNGRSMKSKRGEDSIFGQTGDIHSGTAGMLAIARAFGTMPSPPKRSVVFIAFAGEQRELPGPATWVNCPGWPLEKTVAMFNLGPISGNSADSLRVTGTKQCPDLAGIVRKHNAKPAFGLLGNTGGPLERDGDHYDFFSKGIPTIFFSAGPSGDDHPGSNGPGRIDAGKAAHVSRLAFMTAWTVACERSHYKIVCP